MGLFDKLSTTRTQSQIALGSAEAFAAITLVAVASDGYVADVEIQAVSVALSRMKLFCSYPSEVMRKMIDRLAGIMAKQGTNTLLSAALVALPYELRETAFAVSTDIILADGEVTQEEETHLNHLCHSLEISEDTAVKIIEVMLIKNRG